MLFVVHKQQHAAVGRAKPVAHLRAEEGRVGMQGEEFLDVLPLLLVPTAEVREEFAHVLLHVVAHDVQVIFALGREGVAHDVVGAHVIHFIVDGIEAVADLVVVAAVLHAVRDEEEEQVGMLALLGYVLQHILDVALGGVYHRGELVPEDNQPVGYAHLLYLLLHLLQPVADVLGAEVDAVLLVQRTLQLHVGLAVVLGEAFLQPLCRPGHGTQLHVVLQHLAHYLLVLLHVCKRRGKVAAHGDALVACRAQGFHGLALERQLEARHVVRAFHAFDGYRKVAFLLAQGNQLLAEVYVGYLVHIVAYRLHGVAEQVLHHRAGVALACAEGAAQPHAVAFRGFGGREVVQRAAQQGAELLGGDKRLPSRLRLLGRDVVHRQEVFLHTDKIAVSLCHISRCFIVIYQL